jgi:hypothetical protein
MVPPTKKAASSSSGKSTSSDQPVGTDSPSANPASDGSDETTPATTTTETKTVEVQAQVPVEEEPRKIETTTKDVTFVIPQTTDDRRNIPGTSQYLDEVERRNAELIRAKAEDRKPDLENPPAFQGTPLYTEAQAKQQGLDITGDAVQKVELPVVVEKGAEAEASLTNFDAYNGSGASVLVNSGEPRG